MKTKNKTKICKKYLLVLSKDTIESVVDDYEILEIKNIHKAKKGSISDLYIVDLLDYFPNQESIKEFISQIKDKLSTDAKVYIQGNDIRSVAASLVYGQITNTIFNLLVFGDSKRAVFSMSEIRNLLLSSGFLKINEVKFLNGIQYYFECQKI